MGNNVKKDGDVANLGIEDVFKNKEEYIACFNEALALIRGKTRRSNTISSLIPEYVEIDFNSSIKVPRLFYPKTRPDTVVVQIPSSSKSPRAKGAVREHKIPKYSSIKGIIEIGVVDEFAIRFKLIEGKKSTSVRTTKKKTAKKKAKKKTTSGKGKK